MTAAAAVFFACLLTVPAGALTARIAANYSQEVPWMNKVVVGAMLGQALVGEFVVGLPDQGSGKARDFSATVQNDAYDQVLSLLIDIFGGGSSVHEAAFGKLIDSLRRSTRVDDDFVLSILARLSGEHSMDLQHFTVDMGVEQFMIPPQGDRPGVAIVRYPSHDQPSSDWESLMEHVFVAAELSRSDEGIFLRYIAESHTIEEFAMDTRAEVLFMNELCLGTLEEVIRAGNPNSEDRFDLFLSTFRVVQRLNDLGIPHTREITPDTVLVRRDATDSQYVEAVLSPAIILLESDISEEDLLSSDIRQLGTLLRFLFSGEVEEGYETIVDVFLAFGKAMESGAFSGAERAAAELDDLVHRISAGPTHSDMVGFRLGYLRMAVEAELAAE